MTASEGGSEQEARRLDLLLRSRNREGDRIQHHQLRSVSLVSNNNNNTIANSKIKQNNNINNNNRNNHPNLGNGNDSENSSSQESRKLSYVGLSCAVSGYSPYTKYSTELTDVPRKVTPPAQIPVAYPPQTLDAVLNNYTPMVKPDYELTNNNYSYGDKRNEPINMRQQVIHQESPSGHIPPSSQHPGNRTSENTHSRISNGNSSQNGNNKLGSYDCTDQARTQKCSSGNIITSSFYPTKTQIIGESAPTLERVTQFHTSQIHHNNNTISKGNGSSPMSLREGSPGSDDSGTTSASTCSSSGMTMATASSVTSATEGNLVQKQIQRLYGGKERVVPVRLTHKSSTGSSNTSPPPRDLDNSFERQNRYGETSSGSSSNHWSNSSSFEHKDEEGGFFAKRFGIVKQKEYNTAGRRLDSLTGNGPFSNVHSNGGANNGRSGALDFKPLKIPAVFRLLRPEFREQLKNHSCQVDIPTENGDDSNTHQNYSYRSGFMSSRSGSSQPNQQSSSHISSQSKERIVPIQRNYAGVENSASPQTLISTTATTSETAKRERVIPIRLTSGSPLQNVNIDVKNVSTVASSGQERVIPIQRESEVFQGRKNSSPTPKAQNNNQKENGDRGRSTTRAAAGVSSKEAEEKPSVKSPLKPALPAKPTQTSPPKQTPNKPIAVSTLKKSASPNTNNKSTKPTPHVVKSPALVANCLNKHNNTNENNSPHVDANTVPNKNRETSNITNTHNGMCNNNVPNNVTASNDCKENSTVSKNKKQISQNIETVNTTMNQEDKYSDQAREHNYAFQDDNTYNLCRDNTSIPEYDGAREDYEDEMCQDTINDSYGGGIRERSLLCPILEEDAESTASTSSLTANSLTSGSRPKYVTSVSRYNETSQNNDDSNNAITQDGELEEKESGVEAPAPAGAIPDGHYFIKLMENEIFKFEEQICDFEDLASLNSSSDENSVSIPEDVRDSIFATVGKAKLFMSQKLVQFRGLCDKNIAAMDPEAVPDPFVPTSGDLAGFWDMVYMQVDHIHALFAELRELRSNGWKTVPSVSNKTEQKNKANSTKGGKFVSKKRKPIRPMSARVTGKKTTVLNNNVESNELTDSAAANEPIASKKSEAAKARDEMRKKMMAERKKKMLELKQKAQQDSVDDKEQNVEIFVPI